MRATLGPLLVHVALAAAGYGLLSAFGALRAAGIWRWAAAGGLAYLCGLAGVGSVCIVLLVLGVPLTLATAGLAALALALPALREAPRLLRALPAFPRPERSEHWIAIAFLASLGILFVAGMFSVGLIPLGEYDAWNLWSRKASLLFWNAELPGGIFSARPYATAHPDYPYLLPVFEALHLRGLGRDDPRAVHVPLWLLMGAFVWAGAFIADRVVRPLVWAPVLAGAAVLTAPQLLSGYADVPLAYFLGLGVLALGLWLDHGRRCDLLVAATLLGGAAGMKNEGAIGCLLALGTAGVIVAIQRRGDLLRQLMIAAAALLAVVVVPWQAWLRAQDFHGDLPVVKGLTPGFLLDRLERVWPSVEALHGHLSDWSSVALLVPIALAAVALRLRLPVWRPLTCFYLGVGLLYFVSLVWAYWISPLDLAFHLGTSVSRVYVGCAFIALACLLHLVGGGRQPARAG